MTASVTVTSIGGGGGMDGAAAAPTHTKKKHSLPNIHRHALASHAAASLTPTVDHRPRHMLPPFAVPALATAHSPFDDTVPPCGALFAPSAPCGPAAGEANEQKGVGVLVSGGGGGGGGKRERQREQEKERTREREEGEKEGGVVLGGVHSSQSGGCYFAALACLPPQPPSQPTKAERS